MLRERLSNFFWTEGRKKWSLVAENTQFVHACVLAEIDVMALIGGIWGEKLEVFNGEPVLGPTGGLDVGRRSREGRGRRKSRKRRLRPCATGR